MEPLKRTVATLSILLISGSALAQSGPPVSTHVTAFPSRHLLLVIDLKNTLNATVIIPNCSELETGRTLCKGYFRLEEKTERGWETRLERHQPGVVESLPTWRPYTLTNNEYGANFYYEIAEVLKYGIRPGSVVRVVVYAYDPIYATTFPSNVGSLMSKPRMEIVSEPFVVPTWE